MKRASMILASLCTVALAAGARGETDYSIRYVQMKPGEVLRNHVATYVSGTVSGIGPATRDMNQKVDQWMTIECLEVDKHGVATCRITFDRMAMTQTMGTMTMTFDSAAPASQPNDSAQMILKQGLRALIGKSITAKISAEGKPLEVLGLQELMEAAWGDVPGGKQMARMLEGMFNEGTIKDNWFGGIEQLPRKPVAVGETWNSEQRTNMGPLGQVLVKSKHKLMEVRNEGGRQIAVVATTTNMEVGEGASGFALPQDTGGGKMSLKMTSEGGRGSWRYDLKRGRMLEMTTTAPMEVTAEIQDPAKPDEPTRIVQKAEVSTVMKLLEAENETGAGTAGAVEGRTDNPGAASRPVATGR